VARGARRRGAAASLADETPEGRSIVVLAKEKYGCASATSRRSAPLRPVHRADADERRRSDGRQIRKGAVDAVERFVTAAGGARSPAVRSVRRGGRASQGATPLVVAEDARVLGVVKLKDIVKGGIKERSPSCAAWGSAP
jgi:K+-transporting ATPase ATPase B chain